MRSRVCSGMPREAGELLRTLETVPAVRSRCKASDLRVTAGAFGARPGFAVFFMGQGPGGKNHRIEGIFHPSTKHHKLPIILAQSWDGGYKGSARGRTGARGGKKGK